MEKQVKNVVNIKDQKEWYWKCYDLEKYPEKKKKMKMGIVPEITKFQDDCGYFCDFYEKIKHISKFPTYVCFKEDGTPVVMFRIDDFNHVDFIHFNCFLSERDIKKSKLELEKKVLDLIKEEKIPNERVNREALDFKFYLLGNTGFGGIKQKEKEMLSEQFNKSSSVTCYHIKDNLILDQFENEVGKVTKYGSLEFYNDSNHTSVVRKK